MCVDFKYEKDLIKFFRFVWITEKMVINSLHLQKSMTNNVTLKDTMTNNVTLKDTMTDDLMVKSCLDKYMQTPRSSRWVEIKKKLEFLSVATQMIVTMTFTNTL